MVKLYDFAAEKAAREPEFQSSFLEGCDTLGSPTCDKSIRPHFVSANFQTHYTCDGPGHLPLTWRIDADGDMMHGARGHRYYR